MPLEVTLHPKDFSVILASDKRRLGNRCFALLCRVVIYRSDFKDLHAVTINFANNVYLVPDVGWRSTALQKGCNCLFAVFGFQSTRIPAKDEIGNVCQMVERPARTADRCVQVPR